MNILRVTASTDPSMGGPPQGITNSIAELARLGVHNELVCCDPPDAAWSGMDSFPVHAPIRGNMDLPTHPRSDLTGPQEERCSNPPDQDFRPVAKDEAMRVTGGRRGKRGARGAGFGQRRAFQPPVAGCALCLRLRGCPAGRKD